MLHAGWHIWLTAKRHRPLTRVNRVADSPIRLIERLSPPAAVCQTETLFTPVIARNPEMQIHTRAGCRAAKGNSNAQKAMLLSQTAIKTIRLDMFISRRVGCSLISVTTTVDMVCVGGSQLARSSPMVEGRASGPSVSTDTVYRNASPEPSRHV